MCCSCSTGFAGLRLLALRQTTIKIQLTCCCALLSWPHFAQATSNAQQDPISADVLRDAVMYGEMVQAVYDTLQTKDEFSKDNGYCAPGAMQKGQKLGDPEIERHTILGKEAKEYTVS